ncbi:MAG: AEC family transporter [Pseudomonadota bacterium]
MTAIINVVLPVFAIMLAGYLAGRFRLLGDASSEALNRFVYYGALPALFVVSLANVGADEGLNWAFIAAFGGGLFVTFALSIVIACFVFPNRLGALGLHGMSAIFSNTGYLGIPLLITAFGAPGMLPAILGTVITAAIVMPVCIVILELDMNRGVGPLTILRRVVSAVARNPLVLSAGAGLLFSFFGIALPQPIATFCEIMGAAAGPCALFAIGLFMVGRPLRAGLGEVSWLVLLKLVIQPAITWYFAFELLTMPPLLAASAVILAALPTGALVFVLAQQYNVYLQRSTAAIMISTVVSVATLSALFLALGLE